ncbi:MAG: hypothetical protein OQJ93_04380 [Ignavibacteriaceae bacterium]|jgi:uncharacterized coiled-coil DUF342 family protein|nr:hypothetical protein [Ignavibacteriaceae bacterium]MCW8812301.1 hypothetical protein [Chlorobium sp.]MCW8818055.1 hypothetical protein [Ignavibacteriaceae bacterium]MCW8822689.1 hypothetical protein [Ignavibacteriaceae bacterium]MCW9094549.1 hypothetical protein [Ignavibacteriaceae bacterium]
MGKITKNFTIARYEDAIDKLEAYQAKEPDRTKRDEASAKITEYRKKIREASWQNLIDRTEDLNGLVEDLNSILENASDVPSISGTISDLGDVISSVKNALEEE